MLFSSVTKAHHTFQNKPMDIKLITEQVINDMFEYGVYISLVNDNGVPTLYHPSELSEEDFVNKVNFQVSIVMTNYYTPAQEDLPF